MIPLVVTNFNPRAVDTNAYDEALDDFGNDPNDFM